MRRILLVEDNVDLRESLETFFKNAGFRVTAYGSCEEAQPSVSARNFDIGVIDINLPGRSGFDLLQDIRDNNMNVPLIALTARDSISDKVRGFETGLTDYVVKPFSLAELTARIKAHLRMTPENNTNDISTPSLRIIPDRQEVIVKSIPIKLTATEFRLLAVLAKNNGRIVTTNDLISEGWGEADRYSDPPLRIHIKNLRTKLGDTSCQLIKSVTGTGYMLDDAA
jgi:two-component system response regulator TctD